MTNSRTTDSLVIAHLNNRQRDLFANGIAWSYCRNYEAEFAEVLVVCLHGRAEPSRRRRTSYLSVGTDDLRADLIASPWRLWRVVRHRRPAALVTYDVLFCWWMTLLVRLFTSTAIVIVPLCVPEQVHRLTGRTMSRLPPVVESVLTWLSFATCHRVLCSTMDPSGIEWVRRSRVGRSRLHVVDCLVECLVGADFYEAASSPAPKVSSGRRQGNLLYVGRLHEEKLVLDLVDMMKHLLDRVPSAHLTVVGDGPERDAFLQRAEALGVGGSISWKGAVPNDELLPFYLSADVFVSPFTGMALREAGACGTPIVAYATEAMTGVLVDGQNALLVPHGDTEGLAEAAAQLLSDPERRRALGVAFRETADQLWGRQHLERALHDSFDIPARHRRSSTRTILASVRGRLRPS